MEIQKRLQSKQIGSIMESAATGNPVLKDEEKKVRKRSTKGRPKQKSSKENDGNSINSIEAGRFTRKLSNGQTPSYFVLKGVKPNSSESHEAKCWSQGTSGSTDFSQKRDYSKYLGASGSSVTRKSDTSNNSTEIQSSQRDFKTELEMFHERWNALAPIKKADFAVERSERNDIALSLRLSQVCRELQSTQNALEHTQKVQRQLIEEFADTQTAHRIACESFEKRLSLLEKIGNTVSDTGTTSEAGETVIDPSFSKNEEAKMDPLFLSHFDNAMKAIQESARKSAEDMVRASTNAMCKTLQGKFGEIEDKLEQQGRSLENSNFDIEMRKLRAAERQKVERNDPLESTSDSEKINEVSFDLQARDEVESEEEWPSTLPLYSENAKKSYSNALSQSTTTSTSTEATSPSQKRYKASEPLPTQSQRSDSFGVGFTLERSMF